MATLVQPKPKPIAPVRPVTAEEYAALPNEDGFKDELIRGVVIKMPLPKAPHGRIANIFAFRLTGYVERRDLGIVFHEIGFQVASDPDTILGPDVSFISWDRYEAMSEREGFWQGAPDLAVEVMSPNDRYTQVEAKAAKWIEAGARMVVVIDPRRRQVRVHRPRAETATLGIDDALDGADVIPGWKLPVRALFAPDARRSAN